MYQYSGSGYGEDNIRDYVYRKVYGRKEQKFTDGSIVRRNNGSAPIHVSYTINGEMFGFYVRSGRPVENECQSKFTLYEDNEFTSTLYGEDEMTKDTLYSFEQDGVTKYGTLLTTDSKGRYVLEVRGTQDVIPMDKSLVTEVLPYTIAVQFPGTTKHYAFKAKEGDFSVGDLLVRTDYEDFSFCTVVKVDTKSKAATKVFEGYKVNATKVGGE